jgi:hypothetical protein
MVHEFAFLRPKEIAWVYFVDDRAIVGGISSGRVKGGGLGDSVGMSAKGSPIIFRTIRNLSGRSANIGRILRATGLYFLAAKVSTSGSRVSRSGTGTRRVGK